MTKIIIENIKDVNDLLMFSSAYQKGTINLNITKIATHLNKDRKTVKKYLKGQVPKQTRQRIKYLDEHRQYIKEILTDKYQSFDYIDHLFKYLKEERQITCSRSTLNRYIRSDEELNQLFNRKQTDSFTMRFETEPGYQAQFDMKEKMKLIDQHGSEIKVYIPTLTLSWSRYNHRILTIDTKIETLLSFLAASFEEIGGVPKELVIDNLKQFVEKPRNQGHHAILTTKFDEFCRDYNIQVKPCMPYRPQTKGKTETQNKIVERLKNYNGKYEDIVAMHERLEKINQEDNESISQATKFPRVFLLEKEKGDLNPLPPKEIRIKYHLSLSEVYVSKESMISYQSNKYSVPKKFIGLKVGRLIVRDELHIYYNNKIITTHKITNHLLNIKKEHELIYPKLTTKTIENDHEMIIHEMRHIKYD